MRKGAPPIAMGLGGLAFVVAGAVTSPSGTGSVKIVAGSLMVFGGLVMILGSVLFLLQHRRGKAASEGTTRDRGSPGLHPDGRP